jgi:adenylosuccinate lyase
MDPRYEDNRISKIWDYANKLLLWQKTELAVIEAKVRLRQVPQRAYDRISRAWAKNPIDLDWWRARDEEIKHDLNAFIDERLRFVPQRLHEFVHDKITSFDTIEAAFARLILDSILAVDEGYQATEKTLYQLAQKYRYTIMNARTHGQEAELKTFGARCLTWLQQLRVAYDTLEYARKKLLFSKLSGAVGNYGSIDPEVEKMALEILGFKPFYGSTQIIPRINYLPVAEALAGLVAVLNNIATDIRLAARSGNPLMQEPFAKKQKGSSAMPHKKNPINLEQIEGMKRMASGYRAMIADNVGTQEERAIEQSSVERVAWPDLFHVTVRSFTVMEKVLKGLKVYPDNMLREVINSRGTYASSEAKEFLKKRFAKRGLGHEDAYRIIQLACFNAFEPSDFWRKIRENIPRSFADYSQLSDMYGTIPTYNQTSIEFIIPRAHLEVSESLDVSAEQVREYNLHLRKIFKDKKTMQAWKEIFTPAFLLKNEEVLYREEYWENRFGKRQ